MNDQTFSLASMNESSKNVKKFKDALEKASGQKAAFVTIDKMKKTAGEVSKDLHFGLENGQKVTFVIRKDGDAFRVRLNDKDLPLTGDLDPDYKPTFNAAIKEIAGAVRGNQSKFDKRLTTQKVKIPGKPTESKSVLVQIKNSHDEISALTQSIEQKTAVRDDLKNKLAQKADMAVS